MHTARVSLAPDANKASIIRSPVMGTSSTRYHPYSDHATEKNWQSTFAELYLPSMNWSGPSMPQTCSSIDTRSYIRT
jgi:hypothetical protein